MNDTVLGNGRFLINVVVGVVLTAVVATLDVAAVVITRIVVKKKWASAEGEFLRRLKE